MQATGVEIYKLPADRATEAGRLLAASHANYPIFRSLLPGRRARVRFLRRFMAAAARDAAVNAHALMALESGGMVGAALWMSPGSFPLSGRRKARMAPALAAASAAAPRAMAVLGQAGSALEGAHEPGPSWYLQALGVHPDRRRQGIGRRLLLPPLRLADAAELPCHLHTSDPDNVAYYRRFGFEVVDRAAVPVNDEVGYIGMTRPPGSGVGSGPDTAQE